MTNYYEELKLDSAASPAALQEELIRLEMLWHEREMNRPEVAAKKLVLITEAKKVFSSAAAKASYDRELFAEPAEETPADPDAARRARMEKWRADANAYYAAGQYDLAKTAIEQAMNCFTGEDDPWFYHIAAEIYRKNSDFSTAMNYVNRAIVNAPEEGEFCIEKGLIFEDQYLAALTNQYTRQKAVDFLLQQREMFRQAADKAARAGENDVLGRALGCMAFSLHSRDPRDDVQAESLAQRAVSLGDSWGNAQTVLDEIQKARDDANQRIYDEALKKKGDGTKIPPLEEAIAAFQPITGWRDVDEQIRRCQERIEELRRQAAEAEAAAQRRKKRKRRAAAILAGLAVLTACGVLLGLRIRYHKAGDRIVWKLEDGVLTLTGTGAMDYSRRWQDDWDTRQEIRSVVIGEGVTLVINSAFSDCYSLTSAALPDGLVRIDEYAFSGCESLTEIELPASLRRIGTAAFAYSGLETVTFRGTMAEWAQVELDEYRSEDYIDTVFGANDVVVRCTDGEIYYEGFGEEAES